jgi:hypothetical protein
MINPQFYVVSINIATYFLLIFLFLRLKKNLLAASEKDKFLLLVLTGIQLALAIFYTNDPALVSLSAYAQIVPYGALWFLLNPLWFTVHFYLWYLFVWEMAFCRILWFFYARKKIPFTVIYWYMTTCLFLTLAYNPQSIVPISFVFLIPAFRRFGPLALIPAILTKLPLGWSWDLKDGHWACAFGNSTFVIKEWAIPCNHFGGLADWLIYPSVFYAWFTYGFMACVCIWNLQVWTGLTPRTLVAKILLTTGLFYFLRIFLLERLGLFERDVAKFVKISGGKLFVDVGSANGYYAKLARPNFEKVVTIDPNPKWKADYQEVLGDGTPSIYREITYAPGVSSWTTRFDSIFVRADLVKIDVEGAEFEVLEGMTKSRVKCVIVELHDLQREQELRETLGRMGFTTVKLSKNHLVGVSGW